MMFGTAGGQQNQTGGQQRSAGQPVKETGLQRYMN